MNEQFVRIQNMLFIVFKAINNIYPPEYLRPFQVKRQHQNWPERGQQAATTVA